MRRAVVSVAIAGLLGWALASAGQSPRDLVRSAGFSGGVIVHVGCGDGKTTAELRGGPSFLVQGLDTDAAAVRKARELFLSRGIAGKVSADTYDGQQLPYVEELVNVLVVEEPGRLAPAEMMRVLRPGGVAFVKQDGGWRKITKPWPEEYDQWTHYLHDPQGTSVSNDTVAGYPRGLRWTGGPFWTRSHEHTSGMAAMVSAAGRVFYIMDEGPVESIQLPAEYYLTARDAFNGVVLWKRRLRKWWNWLYPLKAGPGWLPRRLVAVGERVYVIPGIGQNLLCLDAATGKVVRQYEGTGTTFEMIVSHGVLFASVDPKHKMCDYNQRHANCWVESRRANATYGWHRESGMRILKAIEAESGKLLWRVQAPVVPMTLAADARMVCFHDGTGVVALDRASGERLWKAPTPELKLVRTGYGGPRLVIVGDRVVYSPMGWIFCISARDGKILWSAKGKPRSGHFSLEDFYVIGDKIWALQRSNNGAFTVYSLQNGQKVSEFRNPIRSFYIHQRCYPGRATTRYLLPPIMGIQVYDIARNKWENNHWIRGACLYGAMPANGMVYTPPHSCACYYQSKLNGFNAVAPTPQPASAPSPQKRLVKGPAYGTASGPDQYSPTDWPTFRHDNTRSGYTKVRVPATVAEAWRKNLGARLTQPVVAGGRLFVSAVDAHTLYALDAATGKELWHFVAGGRVNSPPTIHKGLVLFGCADGWLYALRASDGQLAWRFQAAPNPRKLVSYCQLESVWPLFGNVLVQSGQLYTVAGRSMFLDGGLRMIILNPETGELIAENVMDRHVPGTKKDLQELIMGKHMPVALPDILSSDGQYVYMKSQTFTLYGKRVRVMPQRPDTQYGKEVHLFAPVSFLDDAWHQRAYWIYGRAAGEGWAEFQLPPKRVPCGRIMALDEKNAYVYGRDPVLWCNTSVVEHWLFCADKTPARKVGIARLEGKRWVRGKTRDDKSLAGHSVDWKQLSKLPRSRLSALDYHWIHEQPEVMARAMVLADELLFVAGPRDVVNEKQMWGHSNEPQFQKKMTEQAEWLRGKHGAVMQVFSKADGKKLAEYKLDRLPSFDGLIAAAGRLYMVTEDGSLLCFKAK